MYTGRNTETGKEGTSKDQMDKLHGPIKMKDCNGSDHDDDGDEDDNDGDDNDEGDDANNGS